MTPRADGVRQVVVATRNPGKLRELEPLLADAGYAAVSLAELGVAESPAEDALECFDSFGMNALAKARHFAALVPAWPVLADDSGLAVAGLGGAPGVRSKRWSERADLSGRELDVANNARLVAAVRELSDRRARYICAAAWVHGKHEVVCSGSVNGAIVVEPRGVEGFGYDPYFLCDDVGRTFGEISPEGKAAVSHRARAVRALLAALREQRCAG